MEHTDWDDLDAPVREAIQRRTGPVHRARTVTAGLNSQLALILDAASGPVFIKGLPVSHPGVVRQHREAMINPHITSVAPRLLWQVDEAGWNLLAFDYIPGARHADYRPGSGDPAKVVAAMNRLQQIPSPTCRSSRPPRRWAAYLDDRACAWLDGEVLLHTDFNPLNVLITPQATWIVDWAWPTRGAAFIDPACFLLRLMANGHSAASAERWAAQCAGWDQAPPPAVDAFSIGSARLFAEIAHDNPSPGNDNSLVPPASG